MKRQDLYDLVWSRANTTLAKELGLRYSDLDWLCDQHDIPRPSTSYWPLLRLGRNPEKALLPNPIDNIEIELRAKPSRRERAALNIKSSVETPQEEKPVKMEVSPDSTLADHSDTVIPIAEDFHGAHKLVRSAYHYFNAKETDSNGLLLSRSRIRVSKVMLRRAFLLIDALFKHFEKQNCSVEFNAADEGLPCVFLSGEKISFLIKEVIEGKKNETPSYSSYYWESWIPTGRLLLKIDDIYLGNEGQGFRRMWSDGKYQRLETILPDFANALVKAGELLQKREERRRKENEEQRKREEIREKQEEYRKQMWESIQAEQARVDELIEKAQDFENARRIRAYIAAILEREENKEIDPNSELAKWLLWAEQQADRLDPRKIKPYSILDDADKYHPDKRRYW
jgi:hypothetical protein